jgi:hypothetical protein
MAIWEQPDLNVLEDESPSEKVAADVALIVPHTGLVTTEWAFNFKLLQLPNYMPLFNKGSPIDVARNALIKSAMQHDVKYAFMLDSDCMASPTAFQALRDVIEKRDDGIRIASGIYWAKKREANMPCAWVVGARDGNDIQLVSINQDPKFSEYMEGGKIIRADVVGMGFCLIDMQVFHDLMESDPDKPFFEWGVDTPHRDIPHVSEDFYFCLRCTDELGVHPHVVTPVQVRHGFDGFKRGDDGSMELAAI